VAGRAVRLLGERWAFVLSLCLYLLGSMGEALVSEVTHYTLFCVPTKLLGGFLSGVRSRLCVFEMRKTIAITTFFSNISVFFFLVLFLFLMILFPSFLKIALDALMTRLVPRSDIGAALAVVDVLGSVTGVIAPLLGGLIIEYGGVLTGAENGLTAKPVVASGGFFSLLLLTLALLPSTSTAAEVAAATKKVQ
jgi:MFS family permease